MQELEAPEQQQPSPVAPPQETESSASPANAEPSDPTHEELSTEDKRERSFRGMQRKLDEVIAEGHKLRIENEFLRSKMGTAPAGEPAQANPAVQHPPLQQLQAPKAEDYDTVAEFLEAREKFLEQKVEAKFQEDERRRKEQEEMARLEDEWAEKETAFSQANPSFPEHHERLLRALKEKPSPSTVFLADAIYRARGGVEIAHYLGDPENADELAEILTFHPRDIMLALGEIRARVANAAKGGETPPLTRAPKPLTPVKKVSATEDERPHATDSPEVWRDKFVRLQSKHSGR